MHDCSQSCEMIFFNRFHESRKMLQLPEAGRMRWLSTGQKDGIRSKLHEAIVRTRFITDQASFFLSVCPGIYGFEALQYYGDDTISILSMTLNSINVSVTLFAAFHYDVSYIFFSFRRVLNFYNGECKLGNPFLSLLSLFKAQHKTVRLNKTLKNLRLPLIKESFVGVPALKIRVFTTKPNQIFIC
ncbi:hypothetical protein OESDEN_14458 [Oesophagostomum dentatum]|uniref:Uncharacterized protein n=1 Tax=Oesophagostomum dentatum TaxID=61180 RepID=A0A0B1SQK2_OESDE|nr:hypothetical protein OESDEN_14458 [Oesophagostomum dentatum]